MAKRKRT